MALAAVAGDVNAVAMPRVRRGRENFRRKLFVTAEFLAASAGGGMLRACEP